MENNKIKGEVDSWIQEYFQNKGTYNRKIYEAMEYSLTIGGKRIRPILLLLTYNLYKESYRDVLPVASALEMIHTYSLIHDDLPCMDDDDLRRGKPTNHKVFGEALAVLAGDGLLNEAMNVMFDYCINKGSSAISACSLISKAAGAEGMIAGQVVDILSEGQRISSDLLYYMHKKKTGELIKASILAGAILGDAPSNEIEALGSYGDKLGLAFQIKDDILDVTGKTELLGKKVNSDAAQNKTTFVTNNGLEKCMELCINLTEECMNILNSLPRNTEKLIEITKFLLEREY